MDAVTGSQQPRILNVPGNHQTRGPMIIDLGRIGEKEKGLLSVERDLEVLITPAARLGWVAYAAAQNRKIGSDGFDHRNFRWGAPV